jgi:hypothetical protein
MIALLAFAMFILALCNWKKPRGYSEQNNLRSEHSRESNIELFGEKSESMKNIASQEDENVNVIMASDETRTFIPEPTSVSEV